MFIDFTGAQAALRQEGNVYRFRRSTSRPPSGGLHPWEPHSINIALLTEGGAVLRKSHTPRWTR